MKKVHLICNAHLDPVWLWRWNEGAAEAVSTFRVAADFCESHEGFVFNHNEALLYEWIEQYEPQLFARIQRLVRQGKWHIMGGWYLQPDCMMPSGESFIRQIAVGRSYFAEKFGAFPTTAINFDPFGHTRGLVQILRKTGYDSYVIMRPDRHLPYGDFVWRGFDGSEVICHKNYGGYNTLKGKAAEKIRHYLREYPDRESSMLLWGIGNHGGGASKPDLAGIGELMEQDGEHQLLHSTCEAYFQTVDQAALPVRAHSLVHCMVGCYTSMARIKQAHRRVENKLGVCERMLSHSGISYDRAKLLEAEKALLLSQFHDILPGSMIKTAENDCLHLLGFAEEIIDRLTLQAFFVLCAGQRPAKAGEIPVMVYNPHPYEIETDLEVEFQLEDQNWTENETTVVKACDETGAFLPTQNEKEDCTFSLDWRKKAVFHARLKPMQLNRFDCTLERSLHHRKAAPYLQNEDCILVETPWLRVEISKKTGLIHRYCVEGKEILKPGSGKLNVYRDNEDPWGMTVDRFQDKLGAFLLLSDAQANEFIGYPHETVPNVRVIENGDVRMKVQAIFKYDRSYATVIYTIPKQGGYIDVNINLLTCNNNIMIKYVFSTHVEDGEFLGQTAFGTERLDTGGREVAFQKWCGLKGSAAQLFVLNKGLYAGSSEGDRLEISLLRTPVYAAHPLPERPIAPTDRSLEHIDIGERSFDLRITADGAHPDAVAALYNEAPYVLSFFPSGEGEPPGCLLQIDNPAVLLSAYKPQGEGRLLRLFNSQSSPAGAVVRLPGAVEEIHFAPFEVKTFLYTEGELKETDMLGR